VDENSSMRTSSETCSACGTEWLPGARYCGSCGASLESLPATQLQHARRAPAAWLMAGGAVLLVALAAGVLWLTRPASPAPWARTDGSPTPTEAAGVISTQSALTAETCGLADPRLETLDGIISTLPTTVGGSMVNYASSPATDAKWEWTMAWDLDLRPEDAIGMVTAIVNQQSAVMVIRIAGACPTDLLGEWMRLAKATGQVHTTVSGWQVEQYTDSNGNRTYGLAVGDVALTFTGAEPVAVDFFAGLSMPRQP
jgi:hypothetical protein